MGRAASGVRAIRLNKSDIVVGAVVLRRADTTILVATEHGFGKRSDTEEYRISHRGGKGIFTMKTTEKTGKMVAIREVKEKDDVVIVSSRGVVIRQHASDIRVAGRNTQGVRLIKLDQGDAVSDVASVPADEDETITTNGGKPGPEGEGPDDADQIGLFDGGEKKNLKKSKIGKGSRGKDAKGSKTPERAPEPAQRAPGSTKDAPKVIVPAPEPIKTAPGGGKNAEMKGKGPAKSTPAPEKKASGAAKKEAAPAKKPAAPVKKEVAPAKKPVAPTKKAAAPAKKTAPAKKPATPSKKQAAPATKKKGKR
jgi:hypothetical protein